MQLTQQNSYISGENNPIDECMYQIVHLYNLQDEQSVSSVLDSLSSIHSEKVKYGRINSKFLIKIVRPQDDSEESEKEIKPIEDIDSEEEYKDEIFTEDEKSFLSLFSGTLKAKSEDDVQVEEIPRKSLMSVP